MKMNRILSIGLAACMTASISAAVSLVSAAETTSILGYSDVATIVNRDNLQIKNNQLTIRNLRSNDVSDEAKEQIEGAADQLTALAKSLSGIMDQAQQAPTDQKAIWQSLAQLAGGTQTSLSILAGNLQSQAAQMEVSKEQRDLVELQLTQVNDQLVSAAQNLYTVCKQMDLSLQQASRSRPMLERALLIAQTSLRQGTGTQSQVTQAQISLTEFDLNLTQLTTQITNLKGQLNTLLGRAYSTSFTMTDLPEPDLAYFNTVNLTKDISAAKQWNYTIRYKNKELKQLEDQDGYKSVDRQKQMKENEISMEENSVASAMANQYSNIQNLKVEYSMLQQKTSLAKLTYDQAVLKYSNGMISLAEKDSAEMDYLSAKSSEDSKKIDLFWQIESYKWMLKGLSASTSSTTA